MCSKRVTAKTKLMLMNCISSSCVDSLSTQKANGSVKVITTTILWVVFLAYNTDVAVSHHFILKSFLPGSQYPIKHEIKTHGSVSAARKLRGAQVCYLHEPLLPFQLTVV